MQTIQLSLDEEMIRDLNRLSSQQQTTPEELIKQFINDYLRINAKNQQ
jgi:metal-responsive CopG/Arc/MetJ family transcriptional regulator